MFVNSASALAVAWGASEKFIAVTIMAIGTSLPELATCVVAALKGRGQLALGNVLGSNISNIILILGGAALIHPISFSSMTTMDSAMLFGASVLIFVTAFTFVKKKIDRAEGAIMLGMEIAYMAYLIVNL
jgi:cation:H+ antiporter